MKHTATAITLLFPLLSPCSHAQGTLTPPGGPEPLMKTLQQIEPRVDLSNAPPSRVDTNDSEFAYVITRPGSYYLSGDLTVGIYSLVPTPSAKPSAIRIDASDVTLDLRGFVISSGPNVGDNSIAIGISGGTNRATILNGTIRGATVVTATKEETTWSWSITPGGFAHGVRAMGTNDTDNEVIRLRNLTVSGCSQTGIDLGSSCIVESCSATNNGGFGIRAPSSTVDRSVATYNGQTGIDAGGGTVTNCVAKWNQYDGIEANFGTVTSSTGSENGNTGITTHCASHCFARGNNINGFDVSSGTLTNCSASDNGRYGIEAYHGAVMNCHATGNQWIGINAEDGAVTSSVAAQNNLAGNPWPEIYINGGTRTGNYPAP